MGEKPPRELRPASVKIMISILRSMKGPRFAGFFLTGAALVTLLTGCVTSVPVEEYTLARAAYDSAKDAEALRYAPALWYNAEEAYRHGQEEFKQRHYAEAADDFRDARIAAEKAENTARVARHNAGDL